MHPTSRPPTPAAKLAGSLPDGRLTSLHRRAGRPVALALAGTLGIGLVMPVVTSPPAHASAQEIGAVATAFRLADQAAVDNVKVDWSSVAGATSYELLRSESATSGFQTVASAPSTTFDDYALPSGHTYYYEVRALDGSGATLAQSAAAHASTSTPTGTFSTYDNSAASSLNIPSSLEADGVFYRFDYQSDANGFAQLVQRTSTDGLTFTGGTVVLARTSDPALASCKLESMNIRRNPATGEFVLWAHYENPTDYTLAQVAVAHAVPGQPFTFDGTYRPLGNQSRDLTFFTDSDGTGYLVSAANNNADLNLYSLSSDWRTITAQAATLFAGQNREAPAMVHVGGYYYLFTSEAAGWLPSQGQYASATSPAGPWTPLRDAGSTATFGAQSGGIVQIGDQYAMMANRWAANWKYPEPTNSGRMLPISFNQGYASYDYFQAVDYNAAAGTIVPVQNGRILSVGKPTRVSGLSADAPSEAVTYSGARANDGIQSSKDNYYKSDKVPFSWEVDLQASSVLSHVNLTTKLVNGSETYYSYRIEGSLDRKTYTLLADETANQIVGFKSHDITSTDAYRYVRITVTKVTNINNGNSADWARGIGELTVFGTPTNTPAPDTAESPNASLAAGTYYAAQDVVLTSATSGARIYYTTDGTTPSASHGTAYLSPVHVTADTTLKVVAVADGMLDSAVVSLTYVIKAGDTPVSVVNPVDTATYVGQNPNLPPTLLVTTASGATRLAAVTWDTSDLVFDQHYRSFAVPGSVEGAFTTTATVETIPQNIEYFIDSGMAGSTSPAFEGVKHLVGATLKNQVADKAFTTGSWGYVTANGGYDGTVAPGTASDKNTNGVYGKNSPSGAWLEYTLPNLAAGTYTLTTGHQEWWTGPRTMTVSVTNSSNATSTIATGIVVGSNTALYNKTRMASGTFTQTAPGDVTVNVYRSGGTEGPAISWLAVADGAVNVDTTQLVVAAPTVTPAPGLYKTPQTVTLATTSAGAVIYYTTDGSTPSKANGTRYSGPFIVDQSATVTATAIKNGTSSGATVADYDIQPVPTDGYATVPVGSTWYDTSGNPIQAHGGNILQKDGWYYWVGENKSANSTLFAGISLYKSQDLKNWDYVKDILTPSSAAALASCNVERPKLVYNAATDTFVLWAHWETATSYAASHLLVATSATVDGDYTYVKNFRPGAGSVTTPDADPTYTGTDNNWGYGSRDFTIFKDPDSADAYLVSTQDSNNMRVYKLTADYTDVDWAHSYVLFAGQRREAPALVKSGDYYFVVTSAQSGWYANQAMYSSTKDISDPTSWSALKPLGNNTTFFSQPTNIVPIQGADGARQYIYMGDRWNSQVLGASTYVWLPLAFDSTTGTGTPSVAMTYQPGWSFDTTSGAVTLSSDVLASQSKPVEASAALAGYPADAANDGNLFNLNVSGDNTNYYGPSTVPFTWTVDLQKQVDLSRIDLAFRSYNGSETYSGFTVEGSNDDVTWTRLVSQLANKAVGFKSNPLAGHYRYVRVSVANVVNDHNGSSASWAAGLVEVQVFRHPTPQTITFDPLADATYGDGDVALTASASSGLAVTFAAQGPCTVDGSSLHLTGAGDCAVTASQLGGEGFDTAPDVIQRFSIAKAAQTITFGALADTTFGDPDVTLTATASSSLPVSYTAAGTCTTTGSKLHVTGAGQCTITASQAGDGNYLAAPGVIRTFNVATPILDNFNRANGTVGGAWTSTAGLFFYRIESNTLRAGLGGPLVYGTAFGATQEAFVTLTTVDTRNRQQGVLLKVRNASLPTAGAISVTYDGIKKAVVVSTVRGARLSWTAYAGIPVIFTAGDVLAARALDNGQVQVYRNGTLIGTVALTTADQAFFSGSGGRIGIWTAVATKTVMDNFGGGTIG